MEGCTSRSITKIKQSCQSLLALKSSLYSYKGNNGANKNFQFTDLDISTFELEDAHEVLSAEILVVICNLADLTQFLRPKYKWLDRDLP